MKGGGIGFSSPRAPCGTVATDRSATPGIGRQVQTPSLCHYEGRPAFCWKRVFHFCRRMRRGNPPFTDGAWAVKRFTRTLDAAERRSTIPPRGHCRSPLAGESPRRRTDPNRRTRCRCESILFGGKRKPPRGSAILGAASLGERRSFRHSRFGGRFMPAVSPDEG